MSVRDVEKVPVHVIVSFGFRSKVLPPPLPFIQNLKSI